MTARWFFWRPAGCLWPPERVLGARGGLK